MQFNKALTRIYNYKIVIVFKYTEKQMLINQRVRQSDSQFELDQEQRDSSSNQNDSALRLKQKRNVAKKRNQRINKSKNHGDWTIHEQKSFMEYMINNRNIFQQQQLRRKYKVFKNMANNLKTRSSIQCRSHHQKLLCKFTSFDKIINHLSNKIVFNSNMWKCIQQNESPQILKKSPKQHIYKPLKIISNVSNLPNLNRKQQIKQTAKLINAQIKDTDQGWSLTKTWDQGQGFQFIIRIQNNFMSQLQCQL